MSEALLKRCLELAETPHKAFTRSGKVGPLSLSSEFPLQSLKKQKSVKTQRGVADVQKKNLKAIEKGKKTKKRVSIKRKLKLLHKPVIDNKAAKIILERFGKGVVQEEEKPKEESTVFTEEDFKRFEKEYVDDS